MSSAIASSGITRLEFRQLLRRLDFFLDQTAIGQGEHIEHGQTFGSSDLPTATKYVALDTANTGTEGEFHLKVAL
jgi:hypothetical protein